VVTLVIGASTNPRRFSNMAIIKLLDYGHSVTAIGSAKGSVKNVEIDTEKKPFENIHTITLYVNPERQKEYYEYILALQPKRIVFNPGTENKEFEDLLVQNNIEPIEACTLVMLRTGQF